jgi:1-acyl-sn-glycerol-3-phosphate acyltransferase
MSVSIRLSFRLSAFPPARIPGGIPKLTRFGAVDKVGPIPVLYFVDAFSTIGTTTMATFEEEYKKIERGVRRLSRGTLLFKKIQLRGAENWVREGPNIIVGNHIGSYKDVSLLLLTVPRQIYFTANKMIFSRKEASELVLRHLRRHMGEFGEFIHVILNPLYAFLVRFVSSNIARVGTIPIDIDGSKRDAIRKCQEYLKQGRAIIALQGRGRVHPDDPNPYVKSFRRGVSYMAYNLYHELGLSVPVTPVSFFGTHILWGVPQPILVNVGRPLFIKDFWSASAGQTIEKFRYALETTVSGLLLDSLKW